VNESLGGIAPALTGRRTSLTVAALLLGVVFSDAGASVRYSGRFGFPGVWTMARYGRPPWSSQPQQKTPPGAGGDEVELPRLRIPR
jgi:hypothetical protein